MDKSTTERKPKKDHNQSRENPPKWENILILQQSRCTNPWSLDTGVDNQHSRHAITWVYRENQKWTKAKQDENQKRSESKRTKPPKMRKYFNTPTIKAHAWSHDTGQRKAKVEKSTTGRKIKKDQNQSGQNPQKWENILILKQSRCTNPWSHDTGVENQHSRHAITWVYREKQKWTKAPQDENPKGSESKRTKPPKMRKYFNTQTIKVYENMITWYRCG